MGALALAIRISVVGRDVIMCISPLGPRGPVYKYLSCLCFAFELKVSNVLGICGGRSHWRQRYLTRFAISLFYVELQDLEAYGFLKLCCQ
jgi:hypothetical protein